MARGGGSVAGVTASWPAAALRDAPARRHYRAMTGPDPTPTREEEFPILASCLYVNHAAIAPWPARVARAVQDFADEASQQGALGYRHWLARESALRERLAGFIGAESAEDIALLKNTSEGVSVFAAGVPIEPGDNIVIPAGEFPSNRLPWLAQRHRGAEVREVDLPRDGDAEQALLDAVDANTRVLAVSSPHWANGFRLDLERLGAHCRRTGALFFVDAIQHLGMLPMDVQAAHIDGLAADAHKWLLGPEGIAVFHTSARARERLVLQQHGWHMLERPFQFDAPGRAAVAGARRFEAGSPNSLGQAALHAALGLLDEIGMATVERRVLANTEQLAKGLGELDTVRCSIPDRPERRSAIIRFEPLKAPFEEVYGQLKSEGVVAAIRGRGIRLSPHFYQGESDMQAVLDAVRRCT